MDRVKVDVILEAKKIRDAVEFLGTKCKQTAVSVCVSVRPSKNNEHH